MNLKAKIYAKLVLLALVLMGTAAAAAPPTIPASAISFNVVDGGSLLISWTNGNGSGRVVIMRKGSAADATLNNGVTYLANANFGQGQEVAPGQFVVSNADGNLVEVRNLEPGTTYYIKIIEYNGTGAATEYALNSAQASQATLSAPTVPSSSMGIGGLTGNAATLTWTPGNGTRRIVLLRQGSAVNANPNDLATYHAHAAFGLGSQIGAGNYVVYHDNGGSIRATGLLPNTSYHFAVLESNGISTPVYLTTGVLTGSFTTAARPTVPSSSLSFPVSDGAGMQLNFTEGNGSRRIIVARAGSPVDFVPQDGVDYLAGTEASFSTAPDVGGGQKVIYDNNGNAHQVTGLVPGTTYYFKIFEYDGAGTNLFYLSGSALSGAHATVSAPTQQPGNLSFSSVSGSSMNVNWTNGNGQGRLVLVKHDAPVDATPNDLATYNASPIFGNGSQIGNGNYVVYAGVGNSFQLAGLVSDKTYQFAIFEFNGAAQPVYNRVNPLVGSQTTASRPTFPASNILFSQLQGNAMQLDFTPGNGQRRIIVARAGQPVDFVPQDGVDYLATASAPFSSAPDVGGGQKVIYDDATPGTVVSGLMPSATYYYRIYEYTGTGGSITYLTSLSATASAQTLSAPTQQATNLTFPDVTGNHIHLSWTNGNGAQRVVLARKGSPVNATPSDLTQYSNANIFGAGTEVGTGNFVVYVGPGSDTWVFGLEVSTTYHFAVFEFSGNSGPVYNTQSPAAGSTTTGDRPTVPASNVLFSMVEGNSMRAGWTPGNGQRRIVVVRAGQPVDFVPQDGVDYLNGTGPIPYNAAVDLGGGQKVIADGNFFEIDVMGLMPATTYYLKIFEYSVAADGNRYLVTNPGANSQSTVATPTGQASNITFTSIGSTSMRVSWTNGNGNGRMLVARKGSPVTGDPANLGTYNPSSAFGFGTEYGAGNHIIEKANINSVFITNLTPGATYHFALYEYNGFSAPVFLTPGTTAAATTVGVPEIQASNGAATTTGSSSAKLNWTNGSGNRRIVLMKQGVPVDAAPLNNVDYFANTFFGSGSEVGSGNFVVFDGIQNSVVVTNLTPGTAYHFAVFEYNDFGAASYVLATDPARGTLTTFVLPITLADFTGLVQDGKVRLHWETVTEQNSAHFAVERSADGRSFIPVGQVAAAGNSQQRKSYNYTDQPASTGNWYYRLKQVDQDGKFAYSGVVRVQLTDKQSVFTVVNPVRQSLQVTINKTIPPGSRLLVHDLNGKLLKQTNVGSAQRLQVNVSNLSAGTYVVTVDWTGGKESVKIIVQ